MDMSGTADLVCAGCQAPLQPGDHFCEQCGARQDDDEPARCVVCAAPESEIDENGYCSVCGARERQPGDRIELDLAVAAAVSDRGRVHSRNEDAVALDCNDHDGVAAVVCDGISSASAGDAAARAAAQAAVAVLAAALREPERDGSTATSDAVDAAQRAVSEVSWTTRVDRGTPACTLVCALARGHQVFVGSVGDSRAYWIDDAGVRQLTVDDSWAEEQVAEGLLTTEEAFKDSRSHAITHWIGADAPDRPPHVNVFETERAGRLLLCSDGLWNYLAHASELGELIEALPIEASAAAVASALADTAVRRGGRDNITVAVVDVVPTSGATK
jgi:serine/threonine protein phosphatase PrpC